MPANESPKQTPEPSLTTSEGVRAWLMTAVAEAAGTDPAHLDPRRPLAELGLGSRQLVTLAAELGTLTGRSLEPSLVFNHPTIDAVAEAVFAPSTPATAGAVTEGVEHGRSGTGDDVAIISMACRFPGGADHPEALWRLLDAGRDAIGEVPPGRWDTSGLYDPDPEAAGKAYTLRGGFLDGGIDRFDAAFFGISPREAAAMDPQQRLLLQTSWETFERAGILPESLNGSATGVYLGLYDSGYLAAASLGQLDGHVGTGSAASVASGRIAYTLGLQGPAVTVDTACSSSLVALHLAARALAGGECDLALAGGATLLVTPRGHVEFSRLRGLSPSGRCSPFSADADGVVWAEGCGLVLLKRLADARRDGDRILAVVRGSAINQDGRSQGLSAPNGPAQERVLRAALHAAGLGPQDLDHVEAHGTGTRLGDPIELRALADVFGPDRPADRPLVIGSLKSNIGHTQAAAGIGGVIKTVLALEHERIPASLHAERPTDHIDWSGTGLRVPSEGLAWPRGADRVRRAGVSAFGISGTNAHVIIEEAPPTPAATTAPTDAAPAATTAPADAAPTGTATPADAAPTGTATSGGIAPTSVATSAEIAPAAAATAGDAASAASVTPADAAPTGTATPADAAPTGTATSGDIAPTATATPADIAPAAGATPADADPAGLAAPADPARVHTAAPADIAPTATATPAHPAPAAAAPAELPGPVLFPLSARSLPSLRGQAVRLLEALEGRPGLPLASVAATLAHHRTHFEHRAVLHASDRPGLLEALRALADGRSDPDRVIGPPQAAPAGKLAFVFPGQGSQWAGMARDLLERDPVFADELDRCDAALRPFTDWSVAAVLRGDPGAPSPDRVDVVQPALFAVMVSLAAVWRARGVVPDAVIGHSQGEVAAACVAGALSLNDAAAVVALRSQALTGLAGTGGMAVVALPHAEVEPLLGDGVSVAAVNSGRATVVAGAVEPLEELLGLLEAGQVFVRRLDVDYASHSALVEPVRATVLDELDGVVACPTDTAWYSTVTAEPVTAELEADYWYTNLRETVRFAPAVDRMLADGYRHFVELSPHPALLTALRTLGEDTGHELTAVGSLRRDEDGPGCLDRAAAELHVHGRRIDWRRLVPAGTAAELPTYAWDLARHWTEPESGAGGPALFDRAAHPLLGVQLQSADETRWTFRDEWSPATADWLPDHTVFGRTVVSGTTLLELCRAALAVARPDEDADVTDLLLVAPLVLPGSGTVEVSVEVVTAGPVPEITVHSRPRGQDAPGWTLNATASAAPSAPLTAEPPPAWPESAEEAWSEGTYDRLAGLGLGYGPAFQGVRSAVVTGDGELLARLSPPAGVRDTAGPYPVHPALLDAALQVTAALGPAGQRALLPAAVGRCVLPAVAAGELTARVRRTGDTGTDLTLDVTLWDADGLPAGRLESVRLRAADAADLDAGSENARHLYEVTWTAAGESAGAPDLTWDVAGDAADPHVTAARHGLPGAEDRADVAVRFWPRPAPDADPAAVAHETATGALDELRRLIALPEDRAPARTVWVTRGAIAAAGGDRAPAYAQSVLWGLVRSARAEHPDLGLTLLDLDDAGPDPLPALRAAAALAGEPELAWRDEELLAPRLVRSRTGKAGGGSEPDRDRSAVPPTDGTVLITGGLGAVGGHIARLLAERGVPRLLLTARAGAGDPRARDAVAALAALGARAEVVACDVTDPAAIAGVLAEVGEEFPLRGVVHCAGVLDDGVIGELTPERLERVLRPKADAAAHLHRLTAGTPLDLFLLVSSAAGVVGNPGQGNYAAANAFLDQLAHHRRASGLPALSLSFGAWAGEGLAAAHADLDRMARLGHRALTPEQGRDLVALALRGGAPHLVGWVLDLPRLRTTDAAGTALWRTLLPAPRTAAAPGGSLAGRLAGLPEPERAERLLALVREEAARALGLPSAESVPAGRPLRDLGMDSVTAVELRNRLAARLGVRLPATLLFDHPTADRLAAYLQAHVLGDTAPRTAPAPARRSGPAGDEPIAVVAMACRLPGSVDDPEDLWRLVAEGRDAVGPFPAERWDVDALYDPDPDAPGKSYAREGGFLDDIESFDAGFFGITPKEAAAMDPQQRLLLETAWEALERAGIVPARLAGSTTGVYVGMFGSDYLAGSRLDQLDGYVGTGSALSVASGRLAYALGLHGPALTVDTACSSSLVATHLAVQALRAGECDLALAGGVTLMVTPQTFVEFSRLRGLSPTGRCRAFSDDADGAVWAEGAGMLVLKRLGDARRDGDEVLAVLRGTAVGQDGRSQGLSAPNGPAQVQVVRRALEQSGLGPADIDYVEAHGTGTTLGDPIEANALAEVFAGSRTGDRPLYLGSLKSNIGHAQAASGVAGLIKVVQAMRHRTLPPTLHAGTPSRHVEWEGSGLRLLQEPVDWRTTGERPRRAGVSAFGISGTNAHVIVEEAPAQPAEVTEVPPGKRLFVLSGRSEAGLRGQAARLARHITADTALPGVAHTLARHRSHFEWRTAVVADGREELLSSLRALGSGRKPVPVPREEQSGKVAFVFAGHGGQWAGMGLGLMSGSEAFRTELTRIDAAVERHAGWSVLNVLRAPEEFSPLDRTEYLQPVLFAVNAALAAAWRELGVTPDAVVGHSLGEITAAYGAGALTLDEAVTAVTGRAQAVVPLVGHGGMLAVELPPADVEELLRPYAGKLFVGAVNGPTATAVSGESEALTALRAELAGRGVPHRVLSTPFASHTPLMEPLRADLLDRLSGIGGTRTPTPLYSSVLAEPVPGDRLDADYWWANLSRPVRFADTIARMLEDGYRYFVELSPHPSLLPAIEAVAGEAGVDAAGVGSLRRGRDGHDVLLGRLGELYTAGYTPDWTALYPRGPRADLPTYAFARERHWLAPVQSGGTAGSPLLGTHVQASDEPGRDLFQTEIDLNDGRFAYLTDHRVTGELWLPGAALLDMVLEAATALAPDADGVELADVRFVQPLRLDAERPVRLQLVLRPAEDGHRDFTVASAPAGRPRWERHVTGRIVLSPAPESGAAAGPGLAALRERCTEPVDVSAVYASLAALGIEYGPAFRGLEEGRRDGGTTALARLAARPAAGHLLHPATLDASFHSAALPAAAPAGRAFVPAGAGRVRHGGTRTAPAWVSCDLRSVDGDTAALDLRLWDEDGHLVLSVDDFRLAALSPLDGALFETLWQPRPEAQEPPGEGGWLILADETGTADELASRLDGLVPYAVARRGAEYAVEAPGRHVLDPADPAQLARLLDEAFAGTPPERIVQLSALDAPPVADGRSAREAARLCCLTTLHLVRALTGPGRPRGGAPRLFVVVRGSQAAGDSTAVAHPEQALAWGFALAAAQEHPELATTLIDLPAEGGTDRLWTQLWHADDERLVALRDTGRLVPRLARTRPDDGGRPERPDGVHLITGGLGGLGRVVAERLVRRGARRIALLGRGAPDAAAGAWLDSLGQRGVRVHLARADVADRDGLTAALDAVRRDVGPITTVVHTAGVLDDATLANLTEERVLRVLAPKVLGTALLTELVPEADDLVLFASAAGLLGSAGQSPYSAANAFLDAWAHHLSRTGRRALSLDWGAWAGVGMVAGSGARAAETGRSGLVALSPQDGGELFDRVLATGRRQLAPMALDMELLALDPDVARGRPLLADLVTVPVSGADGDDLVRRVLAATTGQERAEWLETYVRARVGEVSGGAVDVFATTALKELGLDSLMLVRLRNAFARELGVELPAADVFAAADIRGLARALAEGLPERTAPAEAGREAPAREVPETELRPATRDVVRLLRSAQPDMPHAAHGVGLAVRLTTPVTREELTGILDRLVARHAALRTAVVTGAEGGRQLRVDRELPAPPLRWTDGTDIDPAERLRLLLEPPFDLAAPPLWRFELADGGPRGQVLVFGAHHAVSDLQSLLLVAAEIDTELSGTPLDGAVTNRDVDLLIEAQQGGGEGPGDEWRDAFRGSERLDLTLARPRPDTRSYRSGSVTVTVPDGLTRRVADAASALGVTPAAFCLGTLTVLLARTRERERFVLAVPVDTRIHADAFGAVGFFGVPVPFPAQAEAGERVADVLLRTDRRLRQILAKGAMFSDVLATLARQGLHRANAPLVEVYFNYVRFSGELKHLEVLPAGVGHTDLDLMVTMTPDTGTVRLDHNLDILDADTAARLGEDFLRLLDRTTEDAAERVRERRPEPPAEGPRLALAATFALGHLPLMCEAALEDERASTAEAPYHQVLAALQDPSGVLADPATAVAVVLLRAADLERFGPVDDTLLAELRAAYPAALKSLAERTRKPLVVGILPGAGTTERLLGWERGIAADLAGLPGIAVLGPDEWTRHHTVAQPFDERTERLAHLPFTPEFQAAVALRLAEVVRAVRRPAPKVIAVDGDETLWGGVAGESGPDAVDLTGPRALLARRLLAWRAAGALLVLVSNNDEATVRAVLDRPDGTLKAEHFSVISAAWGPKPARLDEAARTLNLGLDSFLFLDDNPAEIARMRAALPQVLSVTCPPTAELGSFLDRLWPLVPAAATAEDALRAGFYEAERARDAVRAGAGFEDFLARLDLEVDIRELTGADVERGEQLVRRTNQFTLRARSADGGDLTRWRERGEVWTAAARDRFGDYGQIALLAVAADGDRLDVLAWAMSCRALGRGVEERLLAWLADRAGELGCTKVRLTAERTPRNVPARRLLAALGGGDPDDARLDVVVTPEHLRAFRSWDQQ
ncbi:SDR family NAD(P)-dependent oxidoreductase [Streptomyces sp. NPDC002250]|uniref:SDR family NAD(P)-dependent oxidoreductase n=1 Tax=Streptomyces sp. NPDC002250 TaxID=3364641 RepID=UPI0036AF8F82